MPAIEIFENSPEYSSARKQYETRRVEELAKKCCGDCAHLQADARSKVGTCQAPVPRWANMHVGLDEEEEAREQCKTAVLPCPAFVQRVALGV